jgi:hypothetical protein
MGALPKQPSTTLNLAANEAVKTHTGGEYEWKNSSRSLRPLITDPGNDCGI